VAEKKIFCHCGCGAVWRSGADRRSKQSDDPAERLAMEISEVVGGVVGSPPGTNAHVYVRALLDEMFKLDGLAATQLENHLVDHGWDLAGLSDDDVLYS
jgi:hypothetical protein